MREDLLFDELKRDAERALSARTIDAGVLEDIARAGSLTDAVFVVVCAGLGSARMPDAEWSRVVRSTTLDDGAIGEDLLRYVERDFTARSALDIVLFSNGFHARCSHRLAHALLVAGDAHHARLVQARACQSFGADLHPAAKLGRRLFLDHGLGVVIGETAVIGDDCTIFQHVTLGSTGRSPGQRHPTLGARVSVGAGAVIIGAIEIGDDALIGPRAVVTRSVASGVRIIA